MQYLSRYSKSDSQDLLRQPMTALWRLFMAAKDLLNCTCWWAWYLSLSNTPVSLLNIRRIFIRAQNWQKIMLLSGKTYLNAPYCARLPITSILTLKIIRITSLINLMTLNSYHHSRRGKWSAGRTYRVHFYQ